MRRFGKFVSLEADGLHFVFHLARAGWVRFTDSPTDAQLKMGKGHIAARLTFSGGSGPRRPGPDRGGHQEEPGGLRGPGSARRSRDRGARTGPVQSRTSTSMPWPGFSAPVPSRSRASCGARASSPGSETPTATRSCTPPGFRRSRSPSPWTGTHVQRLYDAIHSILGTAVAEASGKAPNELKDTKRSHMRVHGRTGEAVPGMRGHGPGGFLCRHRPAVLPDLPDQGKDPGRPPDVAFPEVAALQSRAPGSRDNRKPRHSLVRNGGVFLLVGLTGFEPATP